LRLGARHVDLVEEGAAGDDYTRLLSKSAKLEAAVGEVVIEIDVFNHPLVHHANHLLLEAIGVREDIRVQRVAEEGPNVLEELGLDERALLGGLVVKVEEVHVVVEAHHHALIFGALNLDVVLDSEVLGKLLVDVLVGLEDRVEVGTRDGVEKAGDLPLQHVLGKEREGRGHLVFLGLLLGGTKK
jgi:hypothetical protein